MQGMRPLSDDRTSSATPAPEPGAPRPSGRDAWVFPFILFGIVGVFALVIGALVAVGRDDKGSAVSTGTSEPTMVSLAEEGMTMLCVTHEMGFARQVANRVIFMDQGQIVEQNDPQNFFDNPQHERTKLFLSQILH